MSSAVTSKPAAASSRGSCEMPFPAHRIVRKPCSDITLTSKLSLFRSQNRLRELLPRGPSNKGDVSEVSLERRSFHHSSQNRESFGPFGIFMCIPPSNGRNRQK